MVRMSPVAVDAALAWRTTEVTSDLYSPKSGSSQRARSRDAAVRGLVLLLAGVAAQHH